MYDYIKGNIIEQKNSSIVIDNRDIGYLIEVANPFRFKAKMKVVIYQHVREDEITLYGFIDEHERLLFLNLISVNGIGPKTALAIISTGDLTGLENAITNGDINYLQKFPKIGKKTAQQIIIDLSTKIINLDSPSSVSGNIENNEVIEALIALGYKEKDIQQKLKLIENSLPIEQKIKEVLQKMLKK